MFKLHQDSVSNYISIMKRSSKYFRYLLVFFLLSISINIVVAQEFTEPIAPGKFKPTWESLKQYKTPEWFRDAKFGIWAIFGPQCQPEQGDWYARSMYIKGTRQFKWHAANYGNQTDFGFKDVINTWKAENWQPDLLVKKFKRAGATYFMAMANHHDNFDMWNSKYQPWNSVNIGPKKDIIAGWEKVARDNNLFFGVSVHASHAWTWYEYSQDYDGNLTKADGTGKWWAGLDPKDLYAQNHPRSSGSDNHSSIDKQWDWGNGASVPDSQYCNKFYNRTIDLINQFNPDLIYFDDTALPLYPVSKVGLDIAADYYNKSEAENNGNVNNVIFGKILTPEQKECLVWDVERGMPDKAQAKPWQTCTCIGNWHYQRSLYDNNQYKSAKTVIQMLVDIVSKNGNLLLSIPIRGDGTIDDKEDSVLQGITKWMDINKESIFGTRPWKIFGEGPTAEKIRPMKAQGFNEGSTYSSEDIRFVQKKGCLYVTALGWPTDGIVAIKSLADNIQNPKYKIKTIKLLGGDKVKYERTKDALIVHLPAEHTSDIALVLKITFKEAI